MLLKRWWMVSILAVIGLFWLAGCKSDASVSTGRAVGSVMAGGDLPGNRGGGDVALSDRLTVAEQAQAAGEYEVALALFREILAEQPTETRAYLGIGDIYLEQENFRTAEPYYERAARIEPRNYRAQSSYGQVLQLLSRFVEAVQVYHRALILDPDGLEANLGLGSTYLEMDEPEHAVAFAEKAVIVDPTNGKARGNLGMVYEANGRAEDAIEQYLIALELIDDAQPVMIHLTRVLINEKRFVEAMNTAASLVKLDPNSETYELLGRAQFKRGAYRESLDSYRTAVEYDARSWSAWNGVGVNALNEWLRNDKMNEDTRLEARHAFRQSLQINNDQQKVIFLMQQYGLL